MLYLCKKDNSIFNSLSLVHNDITRGQPSVHSNIIFVYIHFPYVQISVNVRDFLLNFLPEYCPQITHTIGLVSTCYLCEYMLYEYSDWLADLRRAPIFLML